MTVNRDDLVSEFATQFVAEALERIYDKSEVMALVDEQYEPEDQEFYTEVAEEVLEILAYLDDRFDQYIANN